MATQYLSCAETAGKVIYLGNDGYSDVGALSQELAA